MADSKQDPEHLALRASPRPVARLSRRTIVLTVALVSGGLLAATLWSLQALRPNREAITELHNVERVHRPENLEQLPPDYSKLASSRTSVAPPAIPVLGDPLPGDLGGPILKANREDAIPGAPGMASRAALAAAEDPARQQRINEQREVDEAAKSTLFFNVASKHPVRNGIESGGPAVSAMAANIDVSRRYERASNAKAAAGEPGEGKQTFLDRATQTKTVSSQVIREPASPYLVTAGTVIAAALVTGIESDLPGQIIASVTEPVYDSATGRHLLIPQGSRLIGEYDSHVAFGQKRVLLVWTRLVFPDTSSITLERLAGVDVAGVAGVTDTVDWHWQRLLAGAALSTLIGVGAELAAPNRGIGQGGVVIAMRSAGQDSVNQLGQELTRRNLSAQPTLKIRPGFPVRVLVKQDLILRPYGDGQNAHDRH